jgi:hypothetical protein
MGRMKIDEIKAYWEARGWQVLASEYDNGNQIGLSIRKGDAGHAMRGRKPAEWDELHGGLLDWAERQKAA